MAEESIPEELKDIKDLSFWGLPLKADWQWFVQRTYNKVIPAGKNEKLWRRDNEMGFLTSAHIITNNPGLTISLKLDMAEWLTTIAQSYLFGYRNLGQPGINVVAYDTIKNIYTMIYYPNSYPGDPYKNESWVEVSNTTDTDIIIYYGEINRIVLKRM